MIKTWTFHCNMKPVSHMWRKMGSFSASVSYISAKRNVIKPFQLHYAINCNHRTWPCKALQWKTPPVKLKNWMDKEVEEGKGQPVYFCFCGHDCACAHLYVCTLVKRAHLIHIKVPVCVCLCLHGPYPCRYVVEQVHLCQIEEVNVDRHTSASYSSCNTATSL